MPSTPSSSRAWPARWWHLSGTGLFFVGALFLVSMSPSLLPRTWYYQGIISGLSVAAGYGLGVLLAWIVRGLSRLIELRISVSWEAGRFLRVALPALSVVAVIGITVSNVRSQGRTAEFLRLSPLRPVDWVGAIAVAVALSALILAIARGLRHATHRLAEAAGQVLPRTIASIVAIVVVATATWISDSVVFHRSMQAIAAIAAQVDARQPAGRSAPTSPLISGGPGSLESYASLGYQGQLFVTSAPTAAEIGAATGRTAVTRSGSMRAGATSARSRRSRTRSSPSSSGPGRSSAGSSPSSRPPARGGSTTGRSRRSSTSATATARSPPCSTATCRARWPCSATRTPRGHAGPLRQDPRRWSKLSEADRPQARRGW